MLSLLILVLLGVFAFCVHSSSLFITAVIGAAAVLVNYFSPFRILDFLSAFVVVGSLGYAIWTATELALKLYF